MRFSVVTLHLVALIVFCIRECAGVIYHLNDSEYARMPPLFELDNYDSCLLQEESLYCLVRLGLFAEPANELITIIKEYSDHTCKHYNHTQINRGICVTKKCEKYLKYDSEGHMEDLKATLEACINETIWNEYKLQAKVEDKYFCDKHNEQTSKDVYDCIVLALIFTIIMLNIIGSLCEVAIRGHEKTSKYGLIKYLLCFSIFINWNWLVSNEIQDSRLKKLKGLNSIKCIIMLIFIFGHTLYLFNMYTDNPHQLEKFYENGFYKVIFSGMVLTQALFTISGFLMMYTLLIESEKKKISWRDVPKLILFRLWRITPVSLVYLLFSATWARHLSSGPVWKVFMTDKVSGQCRQYWWSNLLFINNYIPENKFCVAQNWQLAADVQLFILGLCVFVATQNRGRLLTLSLLAISGVLAWVLHIWWQDLDAFFMVAPEFYRQVDYETYTVHKFAHVNTPGYMIGMITAHLLYNCQKKGVDFKNHKTITNILGHSHIPLMILTCYFGSYFFLDTERASVGLRIAYGLVQRSMMALATSVAIFTVVMRFSEFWCNFGEWDGWVVPSKLTYSVSLIHFFLIFLFSGIRKQLITVSILNHILTHAGIAVMSYVCAIPYCLLIEAPFNRLLKAITSRNVQRTKKTT